MPQFAANLTMMFTEVDFLDRFDAAKHAGFDGVEYLFPYEYDIAILQDKLESNGLTQILHNLPAGDWEAGERGIACLPDRVEEFQDGVDRAIEYASALGCKQVNCLAGLKPPELSSEVLLETLISNLKFASLKLRKAGLNLVLEPLNTRDVPAFFVSRTAQARSIIEEVGSDNFRLQHDIYHMQIMEGDLSQTIEDNFDIIGHIQIADTPGRHEPGTGEINYPFLFNLLDKLGYQGWIGCEYSPLTTTEAGLGWIDSYLE